MNNLKPTPQLSMRKLQSQAPKRMGQDGTPVERARLAQTRQERQEKEERAQAPAPSSGKLKKLLPWIATGGALGGGLLFDFFA